MKIHTLLLLCLPALFTPSCTTVTESGTTYSLSAGNSSAINGATIGGQFIASGGNSAKFALYATGRGGVHDKMTVHSLSFRWSSGVTDTVPASYLGTPLNFRNTMAVDTVVQATLHSPGVLRFDGGRESSVTVNADVSIKTRRGVERKIVALHFDRATADGSAFKAGATRDSMLEVRRYGVPLNDLDIGANRVGWKP